MADKQYDDRNRIAIFRNDKGENAKRPDYRGTIDIEGAAYKCSLWKRTSQKGETFLSGSVEPAQPKPAPVAAAATIAPASTEDVPF